MFLTAQIMHFVVKSASLRHFRRLKISELKLKRMGKEYTNSVKDRFFTKKIWVNLLIAVIRDAIMAVLTLVLSYEIWLKANVLNLKPIEGAKVMKARQKERKGMVPALIVFTSRFKLLTMSKRSHGIITYGEMEGCY
jgi:hypothetical protein